MICNTVLDALGNTPLIRLNRVVADGGAEILVKYEAVNVGGSIKTRTAFSMLDRAEQRGEITEDSIIVEPTSGNQGIGLALIGAVRGWHVRIIMPDSVSEERRKLVRAYGAELVLIHDDGDIGACIRKCIETADEMARSDPRVWVPGQFDNPDNPFAQRNFTAEEILQQVDGRPIHGFCSGVGTGGTLSGIGERLKEANPDLVVWASEPEDAAILSGGSVGTHLQMGIGDGLIPGNLNQSIYSHIDIVTDVEAMETSRRLMREEGLMCGISSGTNVTTALRLAKALGPGKTVVTILPDTGERYFSTVLFQ